MMKSVYVWISTLALALLLTSTRAMAVEALLGADFKDDTREWYPPKGIPMKGVSWTIIGDSKTKAGKYPIFGTDRKLTKEGYYYYKLATDPAWFKKHLEYALTDGWKPSEGPLYKGTGTNNYSVVHRMTGVLKSFAGTVRSAKYADPDFKKAVFSPEWRTGCEDAMRSLINERGLLGANGNEYPLAQAFHLLRSALQSGKDRGDFIRENEVWRLPEAQRLIRTLLTDPDVCSPDDRWVETTEEYIAGKKGTQVPEDGAGDDAPAADAGDRDPVLVKGNKVFITGGLFNGWGGSLPSLHATWDGLATINILFSHYPDPDPASPKSIFHLWHKQPAEKRQIGIKMMTTLRSRLWLDHYTNKGPTYSRVNKGTVTGDLSAPNEATNITDRAGYSKKDVFHWANLCWQEMYGTPKGPDFQGVQAFLAICDGKIWDPAMKADIEKMRVAPKSP